MVNIHKPPLLQRRKLRQKHICQSERYLVGTLSQISCLPVGLKEEEIERDEMGEEEVREVGRGV